MVTKIDAAKDYIIEEILPKFKDSTFEDYVKNRLAGDFSYELAEAWVRQKNYEFQSAIIIALAEISETRNTSDMVNSILHNSGLTIDKLILQCEQGGNEYDLKILQNLK